MLLQTVPTEISIPIQSLVTYSFWAFKPFFSDLKQPKQTKADYSRPKHSDIRSATSISDAFINLFTIVWWLESVKFEFHAADS